MKTDHLAIASSIALTIYLLCFNPTGSSYAGGAVTTGSNSGDLQKACLQREKELGRLLGNGFCFRRVSPFVIAGDISRKDLDFHAKEHVSAPSRAMWGSYFRRKPNRVITILLFKGQESYRRWSRRLVNTHNPPYFGFCQCARLMLLMDISTGAGTLVHELTHALILFDFPHVPVWLNEGLASLHEACDVKLDAIIGHDSNWRLPILKRMISNDKLPTLLHFLTNPAVSHAQARYFMRYTQKNGLLRRLYREMRDRFTTPESSVEIVEGVYQKQLEEIERDFIEWVKTLR